MNNSFFLVASLINGKSVKLSNYVFWRSEGEIYYFYKKGFDKFIEIQKEFGSFSKYIWDFVEGKPIVNTFKNRSEMPANTPLSDATSKDLKKRGFKFVGSTIIYAYMQATGIVNDHADDCFRHKELS
jgi:3-methyladenine DNA glycosylase Tag